VRPHRLLLGAQRPMDVRHAPGHPGAGTRERNRPGWGAPLLLRGLRARVRRGARVVEGVLARERRGGGDRAAPKSASRLRRRQLLVWRQRRVLAAVLQPSGKERRDQLALPPDLVRTGEGAARRRHLHGYRTGSVSDLRRLSGRVALTTPITTSPV